MQAALRLASIFDYHLAGPALLADRVGDVRAPACQLTFGAGSCVDLARLGRLRSDNCLHSDLCCKRQRRESDSIIGYNSAIIERSTQKQVC
jgi:hypothetical protein